MKMQQRLIIAMVISVLILFIFQKRQYEQTKKAYVSTITTEKETNVDKMETDIRETPQKVYVGKKKEDRKELSIKNDLLKISINSAGSGLSSILLKDEKEGEIELVRKKEPPFSLGMDITDTDEWDIKKVSENKIIAILDLQEIKAERIFTLTDKNIINVENIIQNKSKKAISLNLDQNWYAGLGTTEDLKKENFVDNRPFVSFDGKIKSDVDAGE
jgi:YidC/Oxa1 family membrane protein insertase